MPSSDVKARKTKVNVGGNLKGTSDPTERSDSPSTDRRAALSACKVEGVAFRVWGLAALSACKVEGVAFRVWGLAALSAC